MHLGCGPRYDDPEAYTLGIPTAAPGTYKLCWSAEQTVEVGDFTLLGPEPASVSCTLGRDCDLELTAHELPPQPSAGVSAAQPVCLVLFRIAA